MSTPGNQTIAGRESVADPTVSARLNRERAALVLSRPQFVEMLLRRGITAQVEAVLAAMPAATGAQALEKAVARAWYDNAVEFHRTSTRVLAVADALEIAPATLDAWFREAAEYR